MHVWQVGESVHQIRFLPESDRLLIGYHQEGENHIDVCSIHGDERVRLLLPSDRRWHSKKQIAIPSTGETCYVAGNGIICERSLLDGSPTTSTENLGGDEVVLSQNDRRLLTAWNDSYSRGYTTWEKSSTGWQFMGESSEETNPWIVGILPDGERFVTIQMDIHVLDFATGDVLDTHRYRGNYVFEVCLSPGGKWLGLVGYSNVYVFNLEAHEKPKRIKVTSTAGNHLVFHPDEETVAIIHDAPTLIKIYELPALKKIKTLRWKLGALTCLDYSPDGMLGAAGSADGRIIVWDVDS